MNIFELIKHTWIQKKMKMRTQNESKHKKKLYINLNDIRYHRAPSQVLMSQITHSSFWLLYYMLLAQKHTISLLSEKQFLISLMIKQSHQRKKCWKNISKIRRNSRRDSPPTLNRSTSCTIKRNKAANWDCLSFELSLCEVCSIFRYETRRWLTMRRGKKTRWRWIGGDKAKVSHKKIVFNFIILNRIPHSCCVFVTEEVVSCAREWVRDEIDLQFFIITSSLYCERSLELIKIRHMTFPSRVAIAVSSQFYRNVIRRRGT